MRFCVSFQPGGVPGFPAVHIYGLQPCGFHSLAVADDHFAGSILQELDPGLGRVELRPDFRINCFDLGFDLGRHGVVIHLLTLKSQDFKL